MPRGSLTSHVQKITLTLFQGAHLLHSCHVRSSLLRFFQEEQPMGHFTSHIQREHFSSLYQWQCASLVQRGTFTLLMPCESTFDLCFILPTREWDYGVASSVFHWWSKHGFSTTSLITTTGNCGFANNSWLFSFTHQGSTNGLFNVTDMRWGALVLQLCLDFQPLVYSPTVNCGLPTTVDCPQPWLSQPLV